MARPQEKDTQVPDHVLKDILSMFSTLDNTREKLNLSTLTMQQLREAMRGYPVRPETAEMIHHHWLLWRQQFLRGTVLGVRTRKDFNGFRLIDLDNPIGSATWDAYLEKERMELERRIAEGLDFDAPQRYDEAEDEDADDE